MSNQINTKSELNSNKLLGLELVRFFSAFSVLIWHYPLFFFSTDKSVNFVSENLPFYSILSFFYNFGLQGVIVFWGISGFIFFWKYYDKIFENNISAKNFFIFRFARLYPLHLATLIIVALLQYLYFFKQNYYFVYQINDLKHFLLHIFLASDWGFQNDYSFNGPIWSVSAEVFSYLIFFIALKKFGKSFIVNIFIITTCVALRILKLSNPVTDCMTIFFLCGSAALIFRSIELLPYKKFVHLGFLIIAIIIPVAIVVLNLFEHEHFIYVFQFVYIPLILFLSAIEFNFLSKFRILVEILGNITYSSYLIHFPVQLLISLMCVFFDIKIDFYSSQFFIIYVTFIFLLSHLIFGFFEKPLQNLIRRKFCS